MSPKRIGFSKETLFTEAVTTIRLQCLCAAIAAVMSIQCKRRPPIKLPSVLVSLGKTISDEIVFDSLENFWFIITVNKGKREDVYLINEVNNIYYR